MQIPVNEVKIENGRLVYDTEPEVQGSNAQCEESSREVERLISEADVAKKRERSIKMSVIGIVLSIFGGIGIVFSIIGIIDGITVRKRDMLVSRYAVTLGIIGCVLSVLFGVLVACLISVLLY